MQYYTVSVFLGEPSEFGLRRCAVELQAGDTPLIAITFYVDTKQRITKQCSSASYSMTQLEVAREFLRAALASEHIKTSPRMGPNKRMSFRRVLRGDSDTRQRLKKHRCLPRAS